MYIDKLFRIKNFFESFYVLSDLSGEDTHEEESSKSAMQSVKHSLGFQYSRGFSRNMNYLPFAAHVKRLVYFTAFAQDVFFSLLCFLISPRGLEVPIPL